MNTYKQQSLAEIANTLLELQHLKNEGRGVECVRAICHYLLEDDFDSAQNTAVHDGDKIRSYPDIHEYLLQVFPEYVMWRGWLYQDQDLVYGQFSIVQQSDHSYLLFDGEQRIQKVSGEIKFKTLTDAKNRVNQLKGLI